MSEPLSTVQNHGIRELLLWGVAVLFLNTCVAAQNAVQPVDGDTKEQTNMSVGISIYLLDVKEYQGTLLPAYHAFTKQGDTGPLVKLIQDVLADIRSEKKNSYWPADVYEEYIAILTGEQYYSLKTEQPMTKGQTTKQDMGFFVDNSVMPFLLELLCCPQDRGLEPRQGMSGHGLTGYLYARSSWIEDYFAGGRRPGGAATEIRLGEWSQFFTKEEILRFDAELSKMTRPEDAEILGEFDNLRSLVHAAAIDPNLTIVFSIS
jgi:hypothetical protein